MMVLKVPASAVTKLRSLIGSEGSRLNPIQDNAGNWIITWEEVNAMQFQQVLKVQNKAIYDKIVEIEYIPKPIDPTIPR